MKDTQSRIAKAVSNRRSLLLTEDEGTQSHITKGIFQ